MTFEGIELSPESGAPIELYEFTVYDVIYRYASGSTDYLLGPVTYAAMTISHTEIEDSDELAKEDMTITVPRDFPINEFFRVAPPSDVILLTVFEVHRTDTDQEAVAIWTGRVLNCESKGVSADLSCENVYTSIQRNGLQRQYCPDCPLELYAFPCNAPIEDFQIDVTLSTVSGLVLTAGAFGGYDDGRFAGGFITWQRVPGQIEKRAIKAHVGTQIQLTHPIVDLPADAEIKAAPGCKHNPDDCTNFFANYDNYGGYPDMTTTNPFGTNNVFLGVDS
jgi:uncharacterized phage protein (TIGR02218 family)